LTDRYIVPPTLPGPPPFARNPQAPPHCDGHATRAGRNDQPCPTEELQTSSKFVHRLARRGFRHPAFPNHSSSIDPLEPREGVRGIGGVKVKVRERIAQVEFVVSVLFSEL
jgi:hypothetical protein